MDYRHDTSAPARVPGMFTAVKIALRCGKRVPTVEWLQSEFGMGRATAYRWRAAYADALGVSTKDSL